MPVAMKNRVPNCEKSQVSELTAPVFRFNELHDDTPTENSAAKVQILTKVSLWIDVPQSDLANGTIDLSRT